MDKEMPGQPLEGGWGWVVVLSGAVVYGLVFGSVRCQSVLFVPIMNEFDSDFSNVGWVSAILTAGLAIGGMISASVMAKFGHRSAVIIGGLIAGASSIVASFSTSVVMLVIFAGLLQGIGYGISFVATPVIIGYYFAKRRSLATNFASMGGSLGTFLICPLNGLLVEQFGIHGYFLIMGGLYFNLCVVGSLMRPLELSRSLAKPKGAKPATEMRVIEELSPGRDTNEIDTDEVLLAKEDDTEIIVGKSQIEREISLGNLLKNKPFLVYCISQLVFLAGFLTSQLYIVPYAEIEVKIPSVKASLLMSIAAAAEIASRVVFGILGDMKRINRVLMYSTVLLVLSVCGISYTFMKSFESLAVAAGVSGLFQGGFSGISIVILADLVGLQYYGMALGLSTVINGIGTLITPPLVGMAVNATKRPSTALYISAGLLFIGAILTYMIQVTIVLQRRRTRRKV
ncbi:monocarboxylate transporter 2-like [Ciona intestinalis]